MSVWQLVAVGLVMLLGLIGVLVPGVPGPAIVWAAVLWWAFTDTTPTAWAVLIGATVLLLLNQALKPLLPPRRPVSRGPRAGRCCWAGSARSSASSCCPSSGRPSDTSA